MRRWIPVIGASDFFVLASIYSLLAVQMVSFADDPGVGWHLKTGQWIWNHNAIPSVDPFLYSAQPRAWISDQWLSDLLFWRLFELGSWPLIYGFLTIVFLSTYFLVLANGLRRITSLYIPSLIAVLVAFKIAQIHFILRPVVFSFFFFAVLYSALTHVMAILRTTGALERFHKFALLVLMPVMFAFWANMHGAFFLGLIYLALVIIGLAISRWIIKNPDTEKLNFSAFAHLLLLMCLCGAATFVTPYGIGLYKSIFSLGGDAFFMRYHAEWYSPDFLQVEGRLAEFSLFVIFLSLLLSRTLRTSCYMYEIVPFLVFLHFGLQSVRVLPFFAIVSSGLLARSIAGIGNAEWISRSPKITWLMARFRAIEFRESKSNAGVVVLVVSLFLLLSDVIVSNKLLFFQGPFGPSLTKFPSVAVEILRDYGSPQSPTVVAAPANWGGYIVLLGSPNVKPIIDDRNVLLGSDFYRSYDSNVRLGKDWQGFLRGLGATHLLLDRRDPLAIYLKQNGALYLLHEDDIGLLFDLSSPLEKVGNLS